MERTFTLQEAQVLLPVLETLLKKAIEGKKLIEQVEEDFQQVANRIFLSGGCEVDVTALARRKAEKDVAMQRVKDALAEIDATGVQVKDIDIGLLDFPCMVEDRVILLCWKLGEKNIEHWHGMEEGFHGRKPINEKIIKAKPSDHGPTH